MVGATKAARLALRATALFIVWLLIDDNVAQPELFTGVVVAMLALAIALRRSSTVHGQVRMSMLRRAWRLPLLLIADTARVGVTVPRSLTGRRVLTDGSGPSAIRRQRTPRRTSAAG